MKNILLWLIVGIIIIELTGCESYIRKVDIGNVFLTSTAGFDKAEEEEQVRITLVSYMNKQEDIKESNIITNEGKSIYEAFLKSYGYSVKSIRWGHTKFLLIGEEAAKDNINKYIDFVSRDYELRLTPNIFITKGSSAEKLISEIYSKNYLISDGLMNISDNSTSLSYAADITLLEAMNMLDSEHPYAYIPCIEVVEPLFKNGKKELYLSGYGIFKGNQLIGYVTYNLARGLNWVIDKVHTSFFVVKDTQYKEVVVEIQKVKSKVDPKINENTLTIDIDIQFEGSIVEYEGNEDIFQQRIIDYLELQMSETVKEEVESIIQYAKKNSVDFLGIGDAVYHKYPVQWESYKTYWTEEFENLSFDIQVTPIIHRIFDLK